MAQRSKTNCPANPHANGFKLSIPITAKNYVQNREKAKPQTLEAFRLDNGDF